MTWEATSSDFMERRRKEIIRGYVKKAKPGNWAFIKAENLGATADYTEADAGEAPSRWGVEPGPWMTIEEEMAQIDYLLTHNII